MARDVVVATFATRNQAYDAAREIDRLDDDLVAVRSGAIVEKDELGNVTRLDARGLGSVWGTVAGVTGGALIGALIGALAGPAGSAAGAIAGSAVATGAATGTLMGGALGAMTDLTEVGLKQDYVDTVARAVLPGRTALVVEVEEGATAPIDAVIRHHGGSVYHESVSTI
jgi:uncharacterized membrane protein